MANDDANKNTVDENNQPDPLEAELDAAIADAQLEDQTPASSEVPLAPEQAKIKVTSPRDRGKNVPVSVEPSKRSKLNEMLDLMSEFTLKEVKQIVKVDKRRRKAERLQSKNLDDLSTLLGK